MTELLVLHRLNRLEATVACLTEALNNTSKLVAYHDRQLNTASDTSDSPQEAKTIDASMFIPEELQTALHRLNLTAITRTQWYEYQAMAAELEKLKKGVRELAEVSG